MSGDGPESIPTSADRRSRRPVKKRALTPVSAQAAGLDALFAKPDQPIQIPTTAAAGPLADGVARLRAGSGGGGGPGGGAPPEVIANVQGSSSGAGSGEFHVYKASRRREYARLRQLDEEAQRDRETSAFEAARRERELRDDEKTRRNREKREKAKARKARGKKPGGGGGSSTGQQSAGPPTLTNPAAGNDDDDDDDGGGGGKPGETSTNGAAGQQPPTAATPQPVLPIDEPGLLIQDDDD